MVAAIVTIQLDIVAAGWVPWCYCGGGALEFFCLRVIAPRVFNDAWFERAIAELGQSMGVTATGLLLLRTVDPDCETEAASLHRNSYCMNLLGGFVDGSGYSTVGLWGGWFWGLFLA